MEGTYRVWSGYIGGVRGDFQLLWGFSSLCGIYSGLCGIYSGLCGICGFFSSLCGIFSGLCGIFLRSAEFFFTPFSNPVPSIDALKGKTKQKPMKNTGKLVIGA
jgi:hypothetical protein